MADDKSREDDRQESSEEKNLRESSEALSKDTQSNQRQAVKPKNNELDAAQKLLDNEIGPVELVGNLEQRPVGGKNEKIEYTKGDKPETLELDEKGYPKSYKDAIGETYVNRDGMWYRHGLLSPDGEPLEDFFVDANRNIHITYRIPKDDSNPESGFDLVTKQVCTDGSEITKYPQGTTKTTWDGATRVVQAMKDGEELHTVKFAVIPDEKKPKPPQCVYFKDSEQNEYTFENGGWLRKTKDSTEKVNWNGSITADLDGCVLVREKDSEGIVQHSTRYFPDGKRADAKNSENRTLTLTDGTTIQNNNEDKRQAVMTTTRPDGSVTTVKFDNGRAFEVTYTRDGQTSTYKREATFNGAILRVGYNPPLYTYSDAWVDKDGNEVDIQDKTKLITAKEIEVDLVADNTPENFTSAGSNPLEHRPLIPEVPVNYQQLLESRLKESREAAELDYSNGTSGIRLSKLFFKTRDGGGWDDKQAGRQYQDWGNVAWGMYVREMELDFESANGGVGLYKIVTGKSRLSWIDTAGQNPADYELTKRGYKLREQQRQSPVTESLKSSQGVELPRLPKPGGNKLQTDPFTAAA